MGRLLSFVSCLALASATALIAMACALPGAGAQESARARSLTQAYNASGQQLFGKLASTPGNIVFSPYSIGSAMAMVLSGARGATAAEMAKVLQHRLGPADIDAANGEVLRILNGYDKSAVAPNCAGGLQWSGQRCEGTPAADGRCPFTARREGERCIADPVRVAASAKLLAANALMMLGKSQAFATAYQALVKDKYAAEVFAGVGLDEVNGWVSNKTEGKIPRMLEALNPDAAAVLLNAIYFKARWASTFSESATRSDAFNLAAARRVEVPMMRRTGYYGLVARQGYRAIRLPYDVGALGMIIVLPDEVEGIATVAKRLDAEELSALASELDATPAKPVALAVPRFKTRFSADLKAVFAELGMREAFDERRADFSGMTGRPASEGSIGINAIVHRAFIDVMEGGTEAAAATAVIMAPGSAPRPEPDPEPFRVDHPFLFLILDRTTGAILFEGRIVDPR
jgi:serpin B